MKIGLLRNISLISLIALLAFANLTGTAQSDGRLTSPEKFGGWKTNLSKRSVDLAEIISGGPPKDGIPAIDAPKFVAVSAAATWLSGNEPVISLSVGGQHKAYPLQILIWHEIVNDRIGGEPAVITFCPLCYTAIAFNPKINGRVLKFGVTGMLRHSDMVMFDRETESWWQQIDGEAIVGELTGVKLRRFPTQIVSFGQFAAAFPGGTVLSRETGFEREYGNNPYRGYDDLEKTPFLYRGKPDKRLRPMEKVVAVEIGQVARAYPHSITARKRVIADQIGLTDIIVFHSNGAVSVLDDAKIKESKSVGSTGVFSPIVDGTKLNFTFERDDFFDSQTGSRWNILGQAVSGKLKGKQLERIASGDYFAFAWLIFKPNTEIYEAGK